MHLLIRKAKISDPRSEYHNKIVDLLIENGVIKKIAQKINDKANKIIEGKNLHVSSGWVDVFADYREPGYEHKETIDTGLAAAAAGGFTQVLLVPNTNPVTDTKSGVKYILQKAAGHTVTVRPLGAVSQNIEGASLAEMLDMQAHGAIAFTDGWKPVQNANLLLKALEYVKAFDGTVIQIPVNESLAKGGLMHEGSVSTRLGMAGIPVLAETIMLHRDIELLRYTGSRLHVTGISTAEGVAMVRAAKKEGLNITCSVTPYHLLLNDEVMSTYDSLYKVTPVIRSEKDRKALVKGLKDGTIDCIASHHSPQEWDAKAKEFEYASDGMNLQEITFRLLLQHIGDEVGLDRLVEAFAIAPRTIFGLHAAVIEKGSMAELTIFTTGETVTLNKENIVSASCNNPFIGQSLKGTVVAIVNNDHIHLNK